MFIFKLRQLERYNVQLFTFYNFIFFYKIYLRPLFLELLIPLFIRTLRGTLPPPLLPDARGDLLFFLVLPILPRMEFTTLPFSTADAAANAFPRFVKLPPKNVPKKKQRRSSVV